MYVQDGVVSVYRRPSYGVAYLSPGSMIIQNDSLTSGYQKQRITLYPSSSLPSSLTLTHTSWTVLLLSFINPAPIGIVPRPLTVPNLTSLTIDRAYYHNTLYSARPLLGSGFAAEYLDLMQRSNYSSNRHLSIAFTDYPINIADLLVASPTLTRLTIGHVAFGQTTLNDLAEGQLGPNLQHLAVVRLSDATVREVLYTILSRNSEGVGKESMTPFRSVVLDYYLDDTDLVALREADVEPQGLTFPSSPW